MIIKNNEEAIRIKCEYVKDEEIYDLVSTLEKELNYSNASGNQGIGLAAAQLGIPKDIAIVRLPNYSFNLVNAKIIEAKNKFIFKEEGCLSFPGRVENTERYQEIVVDNNGTKFIAAGIVAVVCQHEIDHLNSKLFFDNIVVKKPKINIGPNDPCICGKKDQLTNKIKKYKKCCMNENNNR